MREGKRVKPDDRIPFALSKRERDLLLNLTLVDPEVERRLRVAATDGTQLVVGLTLDDVDELAASVAADANHSEVTKTRQALDRIYERLARMERVYSDEEHETPPGRTNVPPGRSFTARQGQYLAFIYYYTKIHGKAPAEADFGKYFRVTAPAVHQMIVTLETQGFIERTPGAARSIRLRLSRAQLPDLE